MEEHDEVVLDLIKMDLIEDIPVLRNTKTSRNSDKADEEFAKVLDPLGLAILNRGTKTSLEEKQKLYKLFHLHISHEYLLGQKFAANAMDTERLLSKDDIDKINLRSKQSLARWLNVIEGNL